jgi:hypothetical protein
MWPVSGAIIRLFRRGISLTAESRTGLSQGLRLAVANGALDGRVCAFGGSWTHQHQRCRILPEGIAQTRQPKISKALRWTEHTALLTDQLSRLIGNQ